MALEDILQQIRGQSLMPTADNRVVDRVGPVQLNRPKNLTSLQNKYADPEYQQAIQQFPEPVRAAIQATDLRRIDRGQSPVNAENTIKAGVAAMTGQAVTPVQDRRDSWTSIPTNAVGDLAQIVKSLPHLPGALVGEVKDVADGFADDKAELAKQGKTGLAATLSLPGIRMIPGTYVASNALSDRQSFIEDPLMNLLDVLPVAGKIAKAAPVVKAAEEAALAARIEGTAGKVVGEGARVRPLKTVATRTLNEAGEVVPNKLGSLIETGMYTKPGMALQTSFGKYARAGTRETIMGEQGAEARMARPGESDVVGQLAKEWYSYENADIVGAKYGITPERGRELGALTSQTPELRATLPANEQQYLADYRAASDTMAEELVKTGDLVKVGGEYFSKADGRRITRAFEMRSKRMEPIFGAGEVSKKVGGQWTTVMDRGILDDLDAMAEIDPRWSQIRDLVDNQNIVGAADAVNDIAAASKKVNQLKWYGNAPAGITDQRMFTIRKTLNEAKLGIKNYDRIKAAINPARFDEVINKRASAAFLDHLENQSILPDRAAAEKFVQTGEIDQIRHLVTGGDDISAKQWAREWSKHRAGIRQNWQALKDAGIDPDYIGRTTQADVRRIGVARFDGTSSGLRTARERVSDVSPSLHSPALSLSKQGWDIIQHESAKQVGIDIQTGYGKLQQDLLDEFSPAAHAYVEARGLPLSEVSEQRARMIRERWIPFDPNKMMPYSGAAAPFGEQVWIPRALGETLQQINSEGLSKMRAFNDPITRAWRTALLPLSPRWHLYNIVGGAVMTTAEVGPGAFRHAGIARDIVKAVTDGTELPRYIPRELERQIGLMGKEEASLALAHGNAYNKWWQQSAAGNAGRKFVQKSFDINSFFDDTYKVMGYLEGEAQALKKFKKAGMSDEVARGLAEQEGIRVARKVLQDVGGQTPFERGILRQVFPFYSWLGHLMRYVFQYPADHPWRAAITASAARIVLEDFGDGASTDMLDLVSWGAPNEKGERKTISARGMNPFSDSANLFTLAGWLGSTNPLFQTATQALGFDPSQGGIDLYPNINYSPETGKMVVDTGNPIQNMAVNSIPQLGALFRYMGQDKDFNKLMREDPEAAQRMLFSGIGVPGAYKRYSLEGGLVKNELKRQEAASNSTSAAYKTGDLDALEPFLGPDAVAALKKARESGAIDQYLPSNTPTPIEAP